MLLRNKLFNTYPCIAHNPKLGYADAFWNEVVKIVPEKVIKPKNLTIATWNNHNQKGFLENNLDSLGIRHTVLARHRWIKDWKNIFKIKLTYEFLKQCRTEFVLFMDCYDVMVVNDILDIVDKFKATDCKALFNAELCTWPPCHQGEPLLDSPFCYLNSGCFIAYRNYLFDFLKDVHAYSDKCSLTMPDCDQPKYKSVYAKRYPEVKIDSTCQIFQTIFIEDQYKTNDILEIINPATLI